MYIILIEWSLLHHIRPIFPSCCFTTPSPLEQCFPCAAGALESETDDAVQVMIIRRPSVGTTRLIKTVVFKSAQPAEQNEKRALCAIYPAASHNSQCRMTYRMLVLGFHRVTSGTVLEEKRVARYGWRTEISLERPRMFFRLRSQYERKIS